MNIKSLVLTVCTALFAVGFIGYMWMQGGTKINLSNIIPTSTPENIASTNPDQTIATTSVSLTMLDTDQVSNGSVEGCDKVVYVNATIPPTTTPVTTALQTLFSSTSSIAQGWLHFIPQTAATLQFQSVSITGGVASVYLSGSLTGLNGVCDNPRADIQIKRTVLQFPGITSVQLYLNNQPVATLAPNMQ
jgi:hypothetical protein